LVSLPAAGHNYNSGWISFCWRDSHPLEWQLASLHNRITVGSLLQSQARAWHQPQGAPVILMQTSARVSHSRVAEKFDFLFLRVVVFLRTRKHLGLPKRLIGLFALPPARRAVSGDHVRFDQQRT
jgi:hypothetical protein